MQTRSLARHIDRICTPVISYRRRTLAYQIRVFWQYVRQRKSVVSALSSIAVIMVQASFAVLLTPLTWAAGAYGLRFLMVDLTQIGSIMWVDLYLRELDLEEAKYRRVFIARSSFTDANAYLLDLYRDRVTFIAHPLLKLLAVPFFVNPWTRDDAFRFDAPFVAGRQIGSQGSYGYDVHKRHTHSVGRPIIGLSQGERQRGWDMVRDRIPPDHPIAIVHARDNGFYGDHGRTTRNSNIHDYEGAFRYLIDRGYTVVRVGDANMTPIDDMLARLSPQLFDYARSDLKSAFLDIWLMSECAFFVGCASGMLAMPIIFNKPSCFVNFYNASTCLGYMTGDVSTFKKIRCRHTDRVIPFDELMQPPLSENIQHNELDALGLYLEDNSPDEILETVREFLESGQSRPTARQAAAKKAIPRHRHSYGAAGDFSETILRQYSPESQLQAKAG